MTRPDLAAVRARHTKGLIQAWLPLEIVRVIEKDVPALLAYIEQLESDLDAAAYRAGVAQGRIGQLQTQIERVRALVGPDNESGMISASAIFHTIGTGNQGDRR